MAILVPPCLGRESCGRLVVQARLHHERDTDKFRCRVPQASALDSTSGRAGLGGASCGRPVAQVARFHRYTARSTRRPPKSACRVSWTGHRPIRCRVPQVSALDSTSGRAGLGGASCGRLVAQVARFHRYTARSTRRPPKSACRAC
jgi:hypothetical protein